MEAATSTTTNQIQINNFILSPNGLKTVGDPSFEEWLQAGEFIRKANGAVHFWIGDWLNYGEKKWGETYMEAVKLTRFDIKTLRNDKWVAARVTPERRKNELSFEHHKEVAEFDADEQEALLNEALNKSLNRDAFRKFVNQRELREVTKEEPTVEMSQENLSRERDNLEKVKSITELNQSLLLKIDELDFDSIPEKVRNELLKNLQNTSRRIEGLLMTFSDE